MPEGIDIGFALKLEPREAVRYFESKGMRLTRNWNDIWQDAYNRAGTVAKVAKMDVLKTIRSEVDKAIKEGITERQFIQNLEPVLRKKGWWGKTITKDGKTIQLGSHHRLKTIYRVNTQVAYNAARYQAQMKSTRRPYLQYVAVMDASTRPEHAELNGMVFHKNDPFWDSFYPPNGWNCRCRVRALSEKQLKSRGLKVSSSKGRLKSVSHEKIDKKTGEVIKGPAGVQYSGPGRMGKNVTVTPDAGWSYNPGKYVQPRASIPAKSTPRIGQRSWLDMGLNKASESELKHIATPLRKKPTTTAEAEEIIREALNMKDKGAAVMTSPIETISVPNRFVRHVVKRDRGRARYIDRIIKTIEEPHEIWLTEMEKSGEFVGFRQNYIGLFEDGRDIAVVVEGNQTTGIARTGFMARDRIDRKRIGLLQFKRVVEK